MKILNLYAGIGGNRKLWGDQHEVTAVEIDPNIAKIYKKFFPGDKVIMGDAHEYLLKHYKEFNFIWSSPPCPTHSRTNNFLHAQGKIRYPDTNLYQEIIFLKTFFKGKWVVENVIPYYEPLIKPQILGRHYFWSNFLIPTSNSKSNFNIANARGSTRLETQKYMEALEEYTGFSLRNIKHKNKKLLLRNCVNPKIALHIFECAFKEKQKVLFLKDHAYLQNQKGGKN